MSITSTRWVLCLWPHDYKAFYQGECGIYDCWRWWVQTSDVVFDTSLTSVHIGHSQGTEGAGVVSEGAFVTVPASRCSVSIPPPPPFSRLSLSPSLLTDTRSRNVRPRHRRADSRADTGRVSSGSVNYRHRAVVPVSSLSSTSVSMSEVDVVRVRVHYW